MPKLILIIFDGFGKGKKYKGNAIEYAKKPFYDQLFKTYPHTFLKASGESVGLPKGTQGGSEVGHFTIGSGRVTLQSLEEIDREIRNKKFFKNKALLSAIKNVKKHSSALHLVGMISDEGVHSHINHLLALLDLAKKHKLQKVYIHAITDGRDVPEKSAKKYIKKILKKNEIASIIGRFYSMDRDTNWKRTKKGYDLMVSGKGFEEKDPLKAIDHAYKRGDETDYYLKPMIINKKGTVKNNDSIIFFNFRTDRAKQLTLAFTDQKFNKFKTKKIKTHFVCMGPYSKITPVAYPTPKIKNNLGEIISKKNLHQLRIAETEKYAHVTFFFNSQIKTPYKNENRILIDSPKVPSYADKPEMSAYKITKAVLKEIKKEKYALIVLNFANTDLVAHSANIKATTKCVEVLDKCISKIVPEAQKHNYEIILTADHGNAEYMLYENGEKCPAHSVNPVPFILISEKYRKAKLEKGRGLRDIAPTILKIMNINKPMEMTGKSLIGK